MNVSCIYDLAEMVFPDDCAVQLGNARYIPETVMYAAGISLYALKELRMPI
jgi:hypothetical protein